MNANTLFEKPKIRVNVGYPKKLRWHISYVGQECTAPCNTQKMCARVSMCVVRVLVRVCVRRYSGNGGGGEDSRRESTRIDTNPKTPKRRVHILTRRRLGRRPKHHQHLRRRTTVTRLVSQMRPRGPVHGSPEYKNVFCIIIIIVVKSFNDKHVLQCKSFHVL